MKKSFRRIIAYTLTLSLIVPVVSAPGKNLPGVISEVRAEGESGEDVLPMYEIGMTDVVTPRSDNILISVKGSTYGQDFEAAVRRINEIRKEACMEGLARPAHDNSEHGSDPMTMDDYHEVHYSLVLECIARMRAGEASVYFDHNRPNSRGEQSEDITVFTGYLASIENLAGYYVVENGVEKKPSFLTVVNQWYQEKENYVNNITAGKGYGHYQAMINPDVKSFGIGYFRNTDSKAINYFAAEFSFDPEADEDFRTSDQSCKDFDQLVEIDKKFITGISLSGETTFLPGTEDKLTATVTTSLSNEYAYSGRVSLGAEWSVTNSNVIEINEATGEIKAKAPGDATVTVSIPYGTEVYTASMDVHVLSEDVTVTKITMPDDIEIESRFDPVLPEKVPAVLSDGSNVNLKVVWEDYKKDNEDIFVSDHKSKDVEIKGVAGGKTVVINVHVKALSDIVGQCDPSTLEIDSGAMPTNDQYPQAKIFLANEYEDVDVDWTDEVKKYYKLRSGGTFELNGLTKNYYYTDNGEKPYPVVLTLIVHPAYVKNVELDTTELTIPSGSTPVFPKAMVTWSNKESEEDTLEWTVPANAQDINMSREGGQYTVTGKYYDAINEKYYDKEFTVTVTVSPAEVGQINFDNKEIEVENGIEASAFRQLLPATAQVEWSNNTTTNENINWDEIPEANLSNLTGGSYVATGKVCGKDVSLNYKVKAPTISSTDITAKDTIEELSPELPEQTKIAWSNGKNSTEKIIWDEIDPDKLKTAGTSFVLEGTLEGRSEKVSITINVIPKTLTNLSWYKGESGNETSPSGTVFYDSYDISKVSGRLIAEYNNNTSDIFSINDAAISMTGYDENSTEKNQTVTLSYSYGTGDNLVTKSVNMTLTLYMPKGLEITEPDKTEYIEGQNLNTEGLKVLTVYDDDSKFDHNANGINYVLSGYDPNTVGIQTITVEQDGVSGTFDVDVLAKRATDIAVSKIPTQKTGYPINLKNVKLTVTYNDGSERIYQLSDLISDENGSASIVGYNNSNPGTFGVFIKYKDRYKDHDNPGEFLTEEFTKDARVVIKDKLVTKIEMNSQPDKQTYIQGDNLVLTGAKIKVDYDDASSEIIDINDKMVSGFNSNTIGNQTVTVTYEEKTTSFVVAVEEKKVVKRYITVPDILDYFEGQSFSYSGFKLHTEYNNNTSEDADVEKAGVDLMLLPADEEAAIISGNALKNLVAGEYTIVAAYGGNAVNTESGAPIKIFVGTMTQGAASELSQDVSAGLSEKASVQDIKNALKGSVIEVPCENGTAKITISADDVKAVNEVSKNNVPKEFQKEGTDYVYKKVEIKLYENAAGEPVTTCVYIPIKKTSGGSSGGNTTESGGNGGTVKPTTESNNGGTVKPTTESNNGGTVKPTTESNNGGTVKPTTESGNKDGTTTSTKNPDNGDSNTNNDKDSDKDSDKNDDDDKKQEEALKKNLASGKPVTIGGAKYKLSGKSSVTFTGPANKNITSASVPATVKVAGKSYKVTTLSDKAFSGCKKLTKIKLGANLESIGNYAFSGCENLTAITIPKKVTKIGNKAFFKCKKLKKVSIGTNIKIIGSRAFEKCTKLKKIVIPKSVTKIGKRAFFGCTNLRTITIKTSKLKKKSIGAKAFKNTYKKAKVKVPKKKLKLYKKYLTKAGLSKTAKVSKGK